MKKRFQTLSCLAFVEFLEDDLSLVYIERSQVSDGFVDVLVTGEVNKHIIYLLKNKKVFTAVHTKYKNIT